MAGFCLIAMVLLPLPRVGFAEEVCFRNLQVCVQKPDSRNYHVYQAPADITYDEVIVNGGLLLRAESKTGSKFLKLSVVKADMTDIYREDFYRGYVYGSIKSKEELGRLIFRTETRKFADSAVTTFEEEGRVGQLAYVAKHKIQLKGNFIYHLNTGRISAASGGLEGESDLLGFLDSLTFLKE
ncbi:MAG TPA: hypothetical protein VJ910_10965 [Desulfuromonadales bacterium]|nr:hypothetical protein [Desulfuromonadales bacterium]